MRAMVFEGVGRPLRAVDRDAPQPAPGQLLVRVEACGICRTDLHLLDGEVAIADPPRILGHQIVGTVEAGDRRVGVPWLGWTCGWCEQCLAGRENLCERARFTGCDVDGGFAEYAVADERFCFPLPRDWTPEQAAPLLCAGLIGYRALRMCGDAHRLGLYGFGAAAHISPRSRAGRAARSTRSPARATSPRRRSHASSARSGPAHRTTALPNRLTPRSSSRPTARSSRSPSTRWSPAGPSSAAAST